VKPVSDQGAEFGGGEEVDVQSCLGPGAVALAAVGGFLDPIVVVLDVGVGGVDPHAQQPAGDDALGGGEQVLMSLLAGAVLEDLDADDQLITGRGRKRGEVADDQLVGSLGSSLAQLADRLGGDVQAGEQGPHRAWAAGCARCRSRCKRRCAAVGPVAVAPGPWLPGVAAPSVAAVRAVAGGVSGGPKPPPPESRSSVPSPSTATTATTSPGRELDTLPVTALTGTGGASVEHGITPSRPVGR
jgi:hypothetical protein